MRPNMIIMEIYDELHEALSDALDLAAETSSKDNALLPFMKSWKLFSDTAKEICEQHELSKAYWHATLLASKVQKSLQNFLNGNISFAYRSMSLWWSTPKTHEDKKENKTPIQNDILGNYGRLYVIQSGDHFYRARTFDASERATYKDMFCVPFALRRKIGNERYSVSGYPCLYAAKSVYACWEELHRPPLDKFRITRIVANDNLYLLDLRRDQPCEDIDDVRHFLVMVPLIIACSIPVQKADQPDPFKLEYVFPQFLMNAVTTGKFIRKRQVHGIIYTSCVAQSDCNLSAHSKGDCIALPVMGDGQFTHKYEKQIERHFQSHFQLTNPVCYEHEIIYHGFPPIDSAASAYDRTMFGILEQRLAEEPLHSMQVADNGLRDLVKEVDKNNHPIQ